MGSLTSAQQHCLRELIEQAFIELRYLEGTQAQALAYAFHNLPAAMSGKTAWNPDSFRSSIRYYVQRYPHNQGFDYLAAFNAVFHAAN